MFYTEGSSRTLSIKVHCVLAGLDLDGFEGPSPPIVGFHLPHICPHPINCMLGVMGIHCNFILGVTSLHCLPVLSEPYLQCSISFQLWVFCMTLYTQPLFSSSLVYMSVFTFISVCRSVFTGLKAVLMSSTLQTFSSFFLRPRMYKVHSWVQVEEHLSAHMQKWL